MSESSRQEKDDSSISTENNKKCRLSIDSKKVAKAQQYLRSRTKSML